jgi:Cdc6-like AAA superfamily ATPase
MSLRRVRDERLFDDARTDADRTRYYVRAAELGLAERADLELMRILKASGPARVLVVGPSGAGKTSLILKVLGDLHIEATDPAREILVLKVGDRPENLVDPAAMIKLVLDTLAAQRYRFSNVDEEVLRAGAADQIALTPRRTTHRFEVGIPQVSYANELAETFETRQFSTTSAGLRQDLEGILRVIRESNYRPVLVLDDTEKFVAPGEDGRLDAGSIANLYDHGVRALADFDVDLVIATHPRFDEVQKVIEVCDRIGPERIEVPRIDPDLEAAPMGKILERRLIRGNVEAPLGEVIEPEAIGALTTLYHDRGSDLRSVLRVAHGAADRALDRGVNRIEVRDVDREVVEARR